MPTKAKATPTAPSVAYTEEIFPEVQTGGRKAQPNPHDEIVSFLAANRDESGFSEARGMIIETDAVKAQVRLLQNAGRAHGVSVQTVVTDNGDGTSKVMFRARNAIKRERKNTDASQAE